MPWCDECSRYLVPTSLDEHGACPSCGRLVDDIDERSDDEEIDESAPWHFKLLVVATVAYLGWRFVQIFT